jgi:glycerol-3-phosphate dehydrogenase subunit C
MQAEPLMTMTYDPHHPAYFDEKDVRDEMTRVFDHCQGCRGCESLCDAFPTLFAFVDRHPDRDAGRLTVAHQDQVVHECYGCQRCAGRCPYGPGHHEWSIDFPRLMLRAKAMRHAAKQVPVRERLTAQVLARTDLFGTLGSAAAPLANKLTGAAPGSLVRRVVQRTTGVTSERLLAPFARQRFSTWFKQRARIRLERRQATAAIFPTCLVEYQVPEVGRDLVRVYERNGVECSLVEVSCCGAPWLHAGDVARFTATAARNVEVLADAVRHGHDIVVPQPTCSAALKQHYPAYVGGRDASLVAEHTFDAVEYLMRLHRGASTQLTTEFPGTVPTSVTYHAPCHLRAQDVGLPARDLLRLTGARVNVVQECAGLGGPWGLRAGEGERTERQGERLATAVAAAGNVVVAGDCQVANTALRERSGVPPVHPVQFLARAYGIPAD